MLDPEYVTHILKVVCVGKSICHTLDIAIPRSWPGVVRFLRAPCDRRKMLTIVSNYFKF